MKAAVCYEFGKPLIIEDVNIDEPHKRKWNGSHRWHTSLLFYDSDGRFKALFCAEPNEPYTYIGIVKPKGITYFVVRD